MKEVGQKSIWIWCCVILQEQCGSYTFIPYMVSPQGKVFACDARMMTCMKELMQPSFQLEPLLTPLVEQLVHLFSSVHIQSRSAKLSLWARRLQMHLFEPDNLELRLRRCSEYFRESIRQEIRMARERFSGQDLSEELRRIQKRLDSVELLTPDIVINLLLSYRDIQVRTRCQPASALKVQMEVMDLW